MFKMYHSKSEKKLEISPIKKDSFIGAYATDKITEYNDCFYVCSDRKLLKKKAEEIKSKWIAEAEKELEQLKDIKIKNKY